MARSKFIAPRSRFGVCVICGHRHEQGKCSPKVLALIDARMKSDVMPPIPRPYGSRLAEGFNMMNPDKW